jgi:hypothetical protein
MSVVLPLSRIARIGALAVVLGVSIFAAVPAQAQRMPHMRMPHMRMHMGMGSFHGRNFAHPFFRAFPGPMFPIYPQPYYYPYYRQNVCLADWQVRNAIEDQGFYNVRLFAPYGEDVRARASRGGRSYIVDFDRCGGYIVSVNRA